MLTKWLALDLNYDSTNLGLKLSTAVVFAIAVVFVHEFYMELPTVVLYSSIASLSVLGYILASLFPIGAKILPLVISVLVSSALMGNLGLKEFKKYQRNNILNAWLQETEHCKGSAIINKTSSYTAACVKMEAILNTNRCKLITGNEFACRHINTENIISSPDNWHKKIDGSIKFMSYYNLLDSGQFHVSDS